MYLVAIHVPIYTAGDRYYLETDWWRSVCLLRDSLEGRFGKLRIIAPSSSAEARSSDQKLEEVDPKTDDVELVPSFHGHCRCRDYWLKHRRQWMAELRPAVAAAEVVHAGLDDVYRPISFAGFLEGRRQHKATVFVQDTDIVLQCRQLARGRGAWRWLKAQAFALAFERLCRHAVSTADLSMLKGSTLMRRYQRYQKNARIFHDTSLSVHDVIGNEELSQRLASLGSSRPLRLVYCGRLTPRKGLHHGIAIVDRARQLGLNVEFDIIGNGEQRMELEAMVAERKLGECVRMLGAMNYGPELFRHLRSYDGLLFTPLAEDTPRMIFDGYAAGLPLIAYDIDYVQERVAEDRSAFLLPGGNIEASAQLLRESLTSELLSRLALAARDAAHYHAAENWYRRRAEWTMEAVERHRRNVEQGNGKQSRNGKQPVARIVVP